MSVRLLLKDLLLVCCASAPGSLFPSVTGGIHQGKTMIVCIFLLNFVNVTARGAGALSDRTPKASSENI